MSPARRLPAVLLVEPQFVMRRTMVSVARELGLVDFHDVSSVARALPMLQTTRFGGMVLDIDDGADALALLERVRAGEFVCRADLPVVAMCFPAPPGSSARLDALAPLRTLQKPFKIKELLASVAMMATH